MDVQLEFYPQYKQEITTFWSASGNNGMNFCPTPALLRGVCSCWLECAYSCLGCAGGGKPLYLPDRKSGDMPRGNVKGSIHPVVSSGSTYGIQGLGNHGRQGMANLHSCPKSCSLMHGEFMIEIQKKKKNTVTCCNKLKRYSVVYTKRTIELLNEIAIPVMEGQVAH